MKTAVIYIRGLNSHGDDKLGFGRFRFGSMIKPLAQALATPERPVIGLMGLGSGAVSEMRRNAERLVLENPLWWDQDVRFHLLGHSTGGLIARALPHMLPAQRFLSVTTLATPHMGTVSVEQAREFQQRFSKTVNIAKVIGYNLDHKWHKFAELSPQAVTEFNNHHPNIAGIDYASMVFACPPPDLCFPFRILHQVIKNEHSECHDGMIEESSQDWGRVIYRAPLDHASQLGYFMFFRRKRREQKADLFAMMTQKLRWHWEQVERNFLQNSGDTQKSVTSIHERKNQR